MAKPRSKSKKLDLIVSEIADLKDKIRKLIKAHKALASAIKPASDQEKPKTKPKPATLAPRAAAQAARKRAVIVKLSDAAAAKAGGSSK